MLFSQVELEPPVLLDVLSELEVCDESIGYP
jgi:hypothetical protein